MTVWFDDGKWHGSAKWTTEIVSGESWYDIWTQLLRLKHKQ